MANSSRRAKITASLKSCNLDAEKERRQATFCAERLVENSDINLKVCAS